MWIDEFLLDRAVRERAPRPVLRIYRWLGPTLSVGAHQRLSDELLARCRSRGVGVVRRPTGGSAVLHGKDLTYAVVAPHRGLGVLETYREVAGALIDGLARLGIDARVGTRRDRAAGGQSAPAPGQACFATTLGADLQAGDAKICGSAQVRRRGWFLQHGSIPLGDDRQLTGRLLRHAGSNNSTCIDCLRPGTSPLEVTAGLVEGFTSRWGEARETALEELTMSLEPAAGV